MTTTTTTTTPRIAVSYYRYSTRRQGSEGRDSLTRQAREYSKFCENHKLTPSRDGYVDPGLSGFKGTHRKKGDMRRLIAAAERGDFPPGTVIVVEAWDRLGRLRPDKQTGLIARLLRTGVRIGVCRLDLIFEEADFGSEKWMTLSVFTQLAYQESKQKSDRKRSANAKNLKDTREGKRHLLTRHLPGWLVADGDAAVADPARAETVRRIFELAGDGLGDGAIVRRLHAEGREPFEGKKWRRSYIRYVLVDRRALGELQPTVTVLKVDGAGRAVVDDEGDDVYVKERDGDPIRGYYPAIITEEAFRAVQRGRVERARRPGKSNVWTEEEDDIVRSMKTAEAYQALRARGVQRSATAVYQRKRRLVRLAAGNSEARAKTANTKDRHHPADVNVFSRLVRDARSGTGYTVVYRNDGGRVPVLVNPAVRDGDGRAPGRVPLMSFPYRTFEAALLSHLAEISPSELAPKKPTTTAATATDPVDAARAARDAMRAKVHVLEAVQADEPSLANGRVLRQAEERLRQLEAEFVTAERLTLEPVEVEWRRYKNLYAALVGAPDPAAARIKLRACLRAAVDVISLLVVPRGRARVAAVQVNFREGAVRLFLIKHVPPRGDSRGKRVEEGYWRSKSWTVAEQRAALAAAGLPTTHADEFNLTTPVGVADAERYLKQQPTEDGTPSIGVLLAFRGCERHPLP